MVGFVAPNPLHDDFFNVCEAFLADRQYCGVVPEDGEDFGVMLRGGYDAGIDSTIGLLYRGGVDTPVQVARNLHSAAA